MYNYTEGPTYKSLMREIKSWGDRVDLGDLISRHTNAHIQMLRDLVMFDDDTHESWRGMMVTNIETMKAVHDSINAHNLNHHFSDSVNEDLDRAISAVRSWDKANGK